MKGRRFTTTRGNGSIRTGLVSKHSRAHPTSAGADGGWISDADWKSRRVSHSSAKDQLTGQAVAVKKIMKPFSTPVLSKRTYRELKLLKHLKHENVSIRRRKGRIHPRPRADLRSQVISLSDIFISPLEDMYVGEYFHRSLLAPPSRH